MQNDKSKFKIRKIKAREILDSRGEPTVEAIIETEQGIFRAAVPSGVSRGKYEAQQLSAEQAVKNVKEIISPKLKGEDAGNQQKIDKTLIELDATKNKSRLGANAILAVSIAYCRAGAVAKNIPLYKYIGVISQSNRFPTIVGNLLLLPRPCFNILEGGAHSDNDLAIQEFMVVPQMETFGENLKVGSEVYQSLKNILKEKFGQKGIRLGDEGGFSPSLEKTEQALDLIMEAAEKPGHRGKIKIGLDGAASQFFKRGKYNFEGKNLSGQELLNFYQELRKQYPILFLEDPFSQDDWQSWNTLMSNVKCQMSNLLIVGDDLTVSNPKRIKEARQKNACNAVILKPNQIGTVTEAMAAAKLAKGFGWKIIVSHRAGETEDDFIADLAVGIGADFIKAGAPGPKERMAKYNRLLKIGEELH